MMLPTHVLTGLALAVPLAAAVPEYGTAALAAGLVGSILPDLDLYAGHRCTLHFPVYYSAVAVLAVPVALLAPVTMTVAVTAALIGAAAHCLTDALGGGLELRPWEATSDRAVYDHYREQWVTARRVVPYDGAPADLVASVALAGPLLYGLDGPFYWIVVAALAVGTVYTVLRRALARWAARIVDRLPSWVLPYVPDRYRRRTDASVPDSGGN
jgi:hypothetical protein